MRIIRFIKRLKAKYFQWRRFASRREALSWAWLQSKNGKTDTDYDKIDIINIKEVADEIRKNLDARNKYRLCLVCRKYILIKGFKKHIKIHEIDQVKIFNEKDL